jgi:hypothetical protein
VNERIRELALEAEEFADRVVNYGGEFHTAYTEKFAELIVKECADIAKHNVMNISTYGDAEFVDEQIRKHFGVEL